MRTKDQFKAAYRDGRILTTKIDIHTRYSTIPIDLTAIITARHPELATCDILDIGCGTGHFLEELVAHGHRRRLVGLDLVAPQRHSSAWEFTEGDAEALSYDDDSFDLVTCLHTLSHINDVPAAMREARRVLRLGGIYIATANSLNSYPQVARYRQRVHDLLGWGQPVFTTSWTNAENLDHVLAPHWDVALELHDGELRIPTTEFAAYFAANIPTWKRQPSPTETARIMEWIADWAAHDAVDGHIVESKRVGVAFCAPRSSTALRDHRSEYRHSAAQRQPGRDQRGQQDPRPGPVVVDVEPQR